MAPAATRAAGVVLTHSLSVALMLGLMLWVKESPRPAIYGIFINYFYRLVTLYALYRLHALGPGFARNLALRLTRPPHPQRPSYQVEFIEGPVRRPAGLGGYIVVVAALAVFTLILVNLKGEQIVTSAAEFGHELRWGLALAFVWWLLDLADRRITLRFDRDLSSNLGYNSTETTTLALTVLSGGVAAAVYGSPWPYFVAFVVFKTLYDVWDEVKFPRGEHPA